MEATMLAIIVLTTLLTPDALPPGFVCRLDRSPSSTTDVETLARFEKATQEYAALHRELARTLFLDNETGDGNEDAVNALPEAIRFVRRNAKRGDIFDIEVAELIRFQIWFGLWHNRCTTADTFAVGRQLPPVGPPLLVNDTLRPHVGQPLPSIMWELPSLPEELEYRLVGRDLVLFDARTRVIVDVVTNALPVN
jgi:hypothetical protein